MDSDPVLEGVFQEEEGFVNLNTFIWKRTNEQTSKDPSISSVTN